MSEKLIGALTSVDWNNNVAWLSGRKDLATRIEACNMRLAVWGRQLEQTEAGTISLSFIREMQHAGHHASCCLSLALYKPAAGAMRSMVECAMYHAYFRTHVSELKTLVRDDKYYVSKKEILEFFVKHVIGFQSNQSKINLTGRLESWYSKTSAIVHGQIPGAWSKGSGVSEFVHDTVIFETAVDHFESGAALVQDIFLCTIAQDVWSGFSSTAKKMIVKGMPGDVKTLLKLDTA